MCPCLFLWHFWFYCCAKKKTFHALELFWSAQHIHKRNYRSILLSFVQKRREKNAERMVFNDNVEGNEMRFMTLTRWSENLHFHSRWISMVFTEWIFRVLLLVCRSSFTAPWLTLHAHTSSFWRFSFHPIQIILFFICFRLCFFYFSPWSLTSFPLFQENTLCECSFPIICVCFSSSLKKFFVSFISFTFNF